MAAFATPVVVSVAFHPAEGGRDHRAVWTSWHVSCRSRWWRFVGEVARLGLLRRQRRADG